MCDWEHFELENDSWQREVDMCMEKYENYDADPMGDSCSVLDDVKSLFAKFEISLEPTDSIIRPIKYEQSLVASAERAELGFEDKRQSCRIEAMLSIYSEKTSIYSDEAYCIRIYDEKDVNLNFKCKVSIYKYVEQHAKLTGNVPIPAKLKSLGSLLDSGDFSDFTFVISG